MPLLPCPCQSLCEFYANHCARIEALQRKLQDRQRARQVEHTATAGLRWNCSWCTIYSNKMTPYWTHHRLECSFCIWIGPILFSFANHLKNIYKKQTTNLRALSVLDTEENFNTYKPDLYGKFVQLFVFTLCSALWCPHQAGRRIVSCQILT